MVATGHLLEGLGHQVTRCEDPTRAAEIVESLAPDIAILDYAMPDLNGADLLAQIRTGKYGKSLPVIFLSGIEPLRYSNNVPPDPRALFLKKPATFAQLKESIAFLLDPGGWSQNP